MGLHHFIAALDARSNLFERMLRRFGVSRQLKSLPDHAAVTDEAKSRCEACWHRDDCVGWLAANRNPSEIPDFCRNHELIARLSWQVGDRHPS